MAPRKAFLLRIDPELWRSLEKWAADELRSVNGQVEWVLARAVREAGRERRRTVPPPPKLEAAREADPDSSNQEE
jgi:hypothetical protein